MKRALAVIAATVGLSVGIIGVGAKAEASPLPSHSTIVGYRCTPDPVNGGRVCANVHWHGNRHARTLVDRLPRKGEVTYLGYTYQDIEDGHHLFSVREGHHYYLYVVR